RGVYLAADWSGAGARCAGGICAFGGGDDGSRGDYRGAGAANESRGAGGVVGVDGEKRWVGGGSVVPRWGAAMLRPYWGRVLTSRLGCQEPLFDAIYDEGFAQDAASAGPF